MRTKNKFELGAKKRDALLERGIKLNHVPRNESKKIKSSFRDDQKIFAAMAKRAFRPIFKGNQCSFSDGLKYKAINQGGTLVRLNPLV